MVLKAGARKEKHIHRRRSVQIWGTHRWTEKLGTHLSRRTGWTGFEERSQSRCRFLIKEKPRGRRPLGKAAPCSEGCGLHPRSGEQALITKIKATERAAVSVERSKIV